MALSDLEIVGVVRRRDLDDTGSEFPVDILVGNDRDPPVDKGKPHRASDQVLVPLVFRMDSNCRITEHRLGTRRREFQKCRLGHRAVLFDQRIFDMPEMTRLFLVLDLSIGDGGVADRTPVDDPAPLVDPSLFVHLHEDFRDCLIASLVHGEALAVPVTGRTELFELIDDPSSVFFSPVPAVLEEFFASQVLLADPLLLEIVDDLDFRRNGGVISAGLPERIIALHAFPTDQYILHGIVQRVAHVELAGNVRRRDHDGKRRFRVVHFCMEVFLFLPVFIDPVLNSLRIIGFGEHLPHCFLSLMSLIT